MNVADHRPGGFQHPGPGTVGDIAGHTLIRHQPRPLPYQHTHALCPGHVSHRVPGSYPGIADKNRLAIVNAPELESVFNGRQTVRGIGQNGCGGQAVPYHQLDGLSLGEPGQNGLVLFVKAPAQVRSGQIFVLIRAPGLDRRHAVVNGKVLRHLAEHRILGRGMVCPEAKHGQGLVPGSGFAASQPRRGFQLHVGEPFSVFRVLRQV